MTDHDCADITQEHQENGGVAIDAMEEESLVSYSGYELLDYEKAGWKDSGEMEGQGSTRSTQKASQSGRLTSQVTLAQLLGSLTLLSYKVISCFTKDHIGTLMILG